LTATLALNGPLLFSGVVARLLQAYMLRETNVKDIPDYVLFSADKVWYKIGTQGYFLRV
jgi:hypothetical protein